MDESHSAFPNDMAAEQRKRWFKPLEISTWATLAVLTLSFVGADLKLDQFSNVFMYIIIGGSPALLTIILIKIANNSTNLVNLVCWVVAILVVFCILLIMILWWEGPGRLWKSVIAVSALFITPILSICLSVLYIRKNHAGHVYGLFYLFFLITFFGFGIFWYLDYIHLIKIGFLGVSLSTIPYQVRSWQESYSGI
jgi:hypothetical protein